ncbi:hypothetical protein CAPTEDRAFT_218749 [Capitella teleta]|uniref:Ig-like domain-containing protein n=1 Tax=Capitella teleta TaxID=283909 RepID=R7U139_CAPTE|nr:hypothetical protein CAPTEDRAFT_218749 [Capitella teleta]|eukprot:ELT99714.1 hypothetical protein CAPTEDRAFT_218749 [Capitella teleta]
MWTSQRLEFEGSNVQLFCRTTGSPTPKITWYDRDGAKITSDQNDYKILGNGDLLIRSIGWMKNMGLYRCEAENGEGKDEVSTFLYPIIEHD